MGKKCKDCITDWCAFKKPIPELEPAILMHKKEEALEVLERVARSASELEFDGCLSEEFYKDLIDTLSKIKEHIKNEEWDKAQEPNIYGPMLSEVSRVCQRE